MKYSFSSAKFPDKVGLLLGIKRYSSFGSSIPISKFFREELAAITTESQTDFDMFREEEFSYLSSLVWANPDSAEILLLVGLYRSGISIDSLRGDWEVVLSLYRPFLNDMYSLLSSTCGDRTVVCNLPSIVVPILFYGVQDKRWIPASEAVIELVEFLSFKKEQGWILFTLYPFKLSSPERVVEGVKFSISGIESTGGSFDLMLELFFYHRSLIVS